MKTLAILFIVFFPRATMASCFEKVMITAQVIKVSKKYVEISSVIGPHVRVFREDIEEIYFPPSRTPEVKRTLIFKIDSSVLGYKCDKDKKENKEETFSEKIREGINNGLPTVRRGLKEFFSRFF